jgi:hypothetical protein
MVLGEADRVDIDHASNAWGTNEGFVTGGSLKNVTLSNSIITESTAGEQHGLLLG